MVGESHINPQTFSDCFVFEFKTFRSARPSTISPSLGSGFFVCLSCGPWSHLCLKLWKCSEEIVSTTGKNEWALFLQLKGVQGYVEIFSGLSLLRFLKQWGRWLTTQGGHLLNLEWRVSACRTPSPTVAHIVLSLELFFIYCWFCFFKCIIKGNWKHKCIINII